MGGAGAGDLGGVLARFWQHARVGGAVDFGAGLFEPIEDPRRGGRRVGLHPRTLGCECIERRPQLLRRQHGHGIAEMAFEARRQFAPVDKQGNAGVIAQDRKR